MTASLRPNTINIEHESSAFTHALDIEIRQRVRYLPVKMHIDRVTMQRIVSRRNLLLRYAHLLTRMQRNKRPTLASMINKQRTKQRKEIAEKLEDIERELLQWLARKTHHRELWTLPFVEFALEYRKASEIVKVPLDRSKFSLREQWRQRWVKLNRVRQPSLKRKRKKETLTPELLKAWKAQRNEQAKVRTKARHQVAQDIQDLDYMWLTALTLRALPDDALPPRRIIKPSRYHPYGLNLLSP
jgi:hypothetical protein